MPPGLSMTFYRCCMSSSLRERRPTPQKRITAAPSHPRRPTVLHPTSSNVSLATTTGARTTRAPLLSPSSKAMTSAIGGDSRVVELHKGPSRVGGQKVDVPELSQRDDSRLQSRTERRRSDEAPAAPAAPLPLETGGLAVVKSQEIGAARATPSSSCTAVVTVTV